MNKNQVRLSPYPLYYRISDFRQLEKCMSNNSRQLHITVSTFVNDSRLNGQRIKVEHDVFGTLFACVTSPKGTLISQSDDGTVFELTTGQILEELKKFGFNITYSPVEHLSGNMIQFLMDIDKLGYDKIRVLDVWQAPLGVKEFTTYIVAFMVKDHGDWLNAGYSPSYTEMTNALMNGTALNISALSKEHNFNWSWLYGWVGDIKDILAENSGCLSR